MNKTSATLHEPAGRLHDRTVDMHRALVSLQEELQAIDVYRQRAEACSDGGLRATFEHHMREEIEHAAMLLEWMRRHDAAFAAQFDTYLYSGEKPVAAVEAVADDARADAATAAIEENAVDNGEPATIGSMKETAWPIT